LFIVIVDEAFSVGVGEIWLIFIVIVTIYLPVIVLLAAFV